MSKLLALLDLFRKGNAVADPALWKHRQITATILIPIFGSLVAALDAFGVKVPIDDLQITQFVTGLVVAINLVLSVTTTDKVGLPPKPEPAESTNTGRSHEPEVDADVFRSGG